jgi:hypothetical protein
MGKYIFGIIKGKKQQLFIANSANHAKQIRKRYVNDKAVIISPIVNFNKYENKQLPLILKEIIKRKDQEGI